MLLHNKIKYRYNNAWQGLILIEIQEMVLIFFTKNWFNVRKISFLILWKMFSNDFGCNFPHAVRVISQNVESNTRTHFDWDLRNVDFITKNWFNVRKISFLRLWKMFSKDFGCNFPHTVSVISQNVESNTRTHFDWDSRNGFDFITKNWFNVRKISFLS